jgi:RNA recognition motif-containing protein
MDQQTTVQPSNRLYITNLNFRTTWRFLKDFIRDQVGNVEHVDFPPRQRGCAIVEFASVEEATQAIEVLNGQVIDERQIAVKFDNKPPATNRGDATGSAIYVSGLPWSVTWYDLKDMCREYGAVTFADVFMDKSGRSRGFGVVRFETAEAANNAIAGLNGTELRSRQIMARLYEENPPSRGEAY